MPINAGEIITAADLYLGTLKLVKYGNRTSVSAAGLTAETGYLRVDGITMWSGRMYLAAVFNFGMTLSGTTSGYLARLRLATSGTATTGSTEIGAFRLRNGTSGDQPIITFGTLYRPSSNLAAASVLLTGIRATGGDTLQMSAGTGGCWLGIFDAGEDVGDSGVDV